MDKFDTLDIFGDVNVLSDGIEYILDGVIVKSETKFFVFNST